MPFEGNAYLRGHVIVGKLVDRPATPPDKSVTYVALDTEQVFIVNDAMQWKESGAKVTAYQGLLYQPMVLTVAYTVPANHFTLFGDRVTLTGDGELIVNGTVYITVD